MSTTELNKLKKGQKFTWGKVIKIHEIGEYAIVEFIETPDEPDKVDENYKPVISFFAYVPATMTTGENDHTGYDSMDAALAACIAFKYEGYGHRADRYFMKMLEKGVIKSETV